MGTCLRGALPEEKCLSPTRSELDLLDRDAVVNYLRNHEIQAVIHAAGFVGGIGLNKAHPGRMVTENLQMGVNVLEAAALAGGVKVAIVSTACVYPDDVEIPTKESDMYAGYPSPDTAFYGVAKRTLHTVAEGLHREFGLRYSYLIPPNLYGPGDHFEESKSHVVPALIRRAIEAKEARAKRFVVWGDGSQTRDLLYVEDAAMGIIASLDSPESNQVLNLGSGVEVSIRELAETICQIVGLESEIVWDTTKPGGAPRRFLDISRARRSLGFQPQTILRDGLQKTVDWYMKQRVQVLAAKAAVHLDVPTVAIDARLSV